jgi:integrase
MLDVVDRRSSLGKRDYAILLLLVTYGLRGHEVAGLTLDHIDWKRKRLLVPQRKASYTTAYPLASVVGEAILDYLKNARPHTEERRLFFRVVAPIRPVTAVTVANQATQFLRKAGIHATFMGRVRYFLQNLEQQRGNEVRTRNQRLARPPWARIHHL